MLKAIFLLLLSIYVLWHFLVAILAIHEWGHALALKRFGMKSDRVVIGSVRLFTIHLRGVPIEIGLIPLWGYVLSEQYKLSDSGRRALVAAAGPAMSIATGLGFLALHAVLPYWPVALAAKGSFVLAATNLIPLPPLDGWTIIEHFVLRSGVKLSPKRRQALLCAGLVAAMLAALLV